MNPEELAKLSTQLHIMGLERSILRMYIILNDKNLSQEEKLNLLTEEVNENKKPDWDETTKRLYE